MDRCAFKADFNSQTYASVSNNRALMSFKPTKSRSVVLKRRKVVDKFRFSLSGATILSIKEQSVKSLRKIFDCSLKDATSIQKTSKELETWLTKVDKTGLPGRFKAWIYQHSILHPVASAGVCSAHDNSRVPGEEDQQLSVKIPTLAYPAV